MWPSFPGASSLGLSKETGLVQKEALQVTAMSQGSLCVSPLASKSSEESGSWPVGLDKEKTDRGKGKQGILKHRDPIVYWDSGEEP